MKLLSGISIIFFSFVIQISFVRLFYFFPIAPNLSFIVLISLCYFLSFEKILILAIINGIAIDLSSSVSFGSTAFLFTVACSLNFYLRENILKGNRLSDYLLNNAIVIMAFYILLNFINILTQHSINYSDFINLINTDFVGEALINFLLSILFYHFVKYCKNGKKYGFTENIKISP